jgi:hypothetical protein
MDELCIFHLSCWVDNLRHQNGCTLWTRNRELITHCLIQCRIKTMSEQMDNASKLWSHGHLLLVFNQISGPCNRWSSCSETVQVETRLSWIMNLPVPDHVVDSCCHNLGLLQVSTKLCHDRTDLESEIMNYYFRSNDFVLRELNHVTWSHGFGTVSVSISLLRWDMVDTKLTYFVTI